MYIIGETAFHHEGDIAFLKGLTVGILESKCDAIKFHVTLNIENYFQKKHPLLPKVKEWLFNKNEWQEIINDAVDKKLDVIALCNEIESARFINESFPNIKGVEVHATGINDFHLLKECSKFSGTVFLGIGGCTINEIQVAIEFLKDYGKNDIVLMYGFQSYPTNYAEVNLLRMKKIRQLFECPVGYADHTRFDDDQNEFISTMGIALGCDPIIEKHFTTNVGEERIDYHSAIGKESFLEIRKLAETILSIQGTGELKMSEKELAYGNIGPMKKALVANHNLRSGDILKWEDASFKRTEKESTMNQESFLKVVGLELNRDLNEDEIITLDAFNYKFKEVTADSYTNTREKS